MRISATLKLTAIIVQFTALAIISFNLYKTNKYNEKTKMMFRTNDSLIRETQKYIDQTDSIIHNNDSLIQWIREPADSMNMFIIDSNNVRVETWYRFDKAKPNSKSKSAYEKII